MDPLSTNKARKVIAFDSWTGGAANIERLVEAFARRGLDLLLIHIGSWGHDVGRPKEERIGGLLVRDISYYPRWSFLEILRQEAPAAVLFLSTQAFAHRAFNRYCAASGIPSLHLYHGLVSVQNTASKRLNPLNVRTQLALISSRVGKSLTRIWPIYAKALWDTGAPVSDWMRFGYDVWLQATGRSYVGVAAKDATTTACCVYTEADIGHAVERYRLPREAVVAVGNPDLIRFGLRKENLGAALSPDWRPSNQVMYVDTALIEAGAVFDDACDFVQHLLETRDALARQGLRLVVKLHPAHFRTGVPDLLKQQGVEQCANEDFVPQMKQCRAVIVEPTSAALIPALCGLPLLLARYGKLSGQDYGDVLTGHPRARFLGAVSDTRSLIQEIEAQKDVAAVSKWIYENAGPMPTDEMPGRVAQVVGDMILGQNDRKPPVFLRALSESAV